MCVSLFSRSRSSISLGLADNDFSDFNRPEHYIRHIGMLWWHSSAFNGQPYHQSHSRVNLLSKLNMTWTNKVCTDSVYLRQFLIASSIDQEWLDAVNVERKKEQLNGVSYETFEIVMDRLEKEWFDLVGSSCGLVNSLPLTSHEIDQKYTQT